MKNILFLILAMLPFSISVAQDRGDSSKGENEQEKISKLVKLFGNFKLSGYIQSQLEVGQQDATLNVGGERLESEEWFTRVGVRRGRLKVTYDDKLSTAVLHIDATEKGISVIDVYYSITDPWINCFGLKAGMFLKPFGRELFYSSSVRESPERSLLFSTLFPGMRDVGASFMFQGPKSTKWNNLKLETGVFAGNGLNKETDSRKDCSTTLSYDVKKPKVEWGVGASFYLGGVFQGTEKNFIMRDNHFVEEKARIGSYAMRRYYGINAEYRVKSLLGTTHLLGDVIYGNQPGTSTSTKSPNTSKALSVDLFQRNFLGWVAYFVQDIGKTKHSIVVKYDGYDPNLDIAGNSIGATGSLTGAADLLRHNVGVGYLYKFNKHFLGMLYYNFAFNETTASLEGLAIRQKADSFTLRLQYAF